MVYVISDSSSVHHQEFFTVHTAMIYVIRVCWQLESRIRMFRPDPAHKLSAKPVWHISLLCVQWKTPDDGQRNCPKCVEFYSKNKFEKLVLLVGFNIRIYHDAQSPEGKKKYVISAKNWALDCPASTIVTILNTLSMPKMQPKWHLPFLLFWHLYFVIFFAVNVWHVLLPQYLTERHSCDSDRCCWNVWQMCDVK